MEVETGGSALASPGSQTPVDEEKGKKRCLIHKGNKIIDLRLTNKS